MLALLESKKLLSDTSEVRNLDLVMALFMKIAHDVRDYGVLDGDEKFEKFDDCVLAYANKFGIQLKGPKEIDQLAAECDGTVKLPVATAANLTCGPSTRPSRTSKRCMAARLAREQRPRSAVTIMISQP